MEKNKDLLDFYAKLSQNLPPEAFTKEFNLKRQKEKVQTEEVKTVTFSKNVNLVPINEDVSIRNNFTSIFPPNESSYFSDRFAKENHTAPKPNSDPLVEVDDGKINNYILNNLLKHCKHCLLSTWSNEHLDSHMKISHKFNHEEADVGKVNKNIQNHTTKKSSREPNDINTFVSSSSIPSLPTNESVSSYSFSSMDSFISQNMNNISKSLETGFDKSDQNTNDTPVVSSSMSKSKSKDYITSNSYTSMDSSKSYGYNSYSTDHHNTEIKTMEIKREQDNITKFVTCPDCGYPTPYVNNLSLELHLREAHYYCPEYKYSVSSKDNISLKLIIRKTEDSPRKELHCSFCDYSTLYTYFLNYHVSSIHPATSTTQLEFLYKKEPAKDLFPRTDYIQKFENVSDDGTANNYNSTTYPATKLEFTTTSSTVAPYSSIYTNTNEMINYNLYSQGYSTMTSGYMNNGNYIGSETHMLETDIKTEPVFSTNSMTDQKYKFETVSSQNNNNTFSLPKENDTQGKSTAFIIKDEPLYSNYETPHSTSNDFDMNDLKREHRAIEPHEEAFAAATGGYLAGSSKHSLMNGFADGLGDEKMSQQMLDNNFFSSRDEKEHSQKLPISVLEIINLPLDQLNNTLSQHQLTEDQYKLCKDIRRRGKNRVAAKISRKRKILQIKQLESDIHVVRDEKGQLIWENNTLQQQRTEWNDRLGRLSEHVLKELGKDSRYWYIDIPENGQPNILPRNPF